MKKIVSLLLSFLIAALPAFPQSAEKLRVIAAPGITKSNAKDWKNTLSVSGQKLALDCPKCLPTQSVTVSISDISALRYGQNAYYHSVSGVATGIFSLGLGSSLV